MTIETMIIEGHTLRVTSHHPFDYDRKVYVHSHFVASIDRRPKHQLDDDIEVASGIGDTVADAIEDAVSKL